MYKLYARALSVDPHNVEALANLGLLLHESFNNSQLAMKALTQVASLKDQEI